MDRRNHEADQVLRKLAPINLPPLPDQPLFSVLIRSYNYARYVGIALESVLAQTYTNFEVIVCDDGSTDNSREVIQPYVKKDSRFKLVVQENGGIASAANTAYAESKGGVICFLDADDVFRPSKLEQVLTAFRKNPRSGMCAHFIQPISAEGQSLGAPFPPDIDHGWIGPNALRTGGLTRVPTNSGLSFRREVASEVFPIPTQIKVIDDYYLSTAKFFTEVSLVPGCLADYRIHGRNHSGALRGKPRPFWLRCDADGHTGYAEDLERVLPFQKALLSRLYGPAIAEVLRLEDHQGYWDVLLGVRALRGRRAGAIRPYTVEEMISHVTRPANRRLWRIIMSLPDPLAKRAYSFWRGPSPLKRAVKAVVLPIIRR
jgi:glycosyltransferase involved in cell wall biosynthesis